MKFSKFELNYNVANSDVMHYQSITDWALSMLKYNNSLIFSVHRNPLIMTSSSALDPQAVITGMPRSRGVWPVTSHGLRSAGTRTANTGHSHNAGSMLGQRRRRWANVYPAVGECLLFLRGHHLTKGFPRTPPSLRLSLCLCVSISLPGKVKKR